MGRRRDGKTLHAGVVAPQPQTRRRAATLAETVARDAADAVMEMPPRKEGDGACGLAGEDGLGGCRRRGEAGRAAELLALRHAG